MPQRDDLDLVSPSDAAKILGVSPTWLYRARKYGRGPRFVVLSDEGSRVIRYALVDIRAWLASRPRGR